MKRLYFYLLVGVSLASIAAAVLLISKSQTFPTDKLLDLAPTCISLVIAIIALSLSDKKEPSVKFEHQISVTEPNEVSLSDVKGEEVIKWFHNRKLKAVTTYRVNFKLWNKSGFDLRNVLISFRLPTKYQGPCSQHGKYYIGYNSNIYNVPEEAKRFEFGNTVLLYTSAIPYLSDREFITCWFRMALDEGDDVPHKVYINMSAENSEGHTEIVQRSAGELIRQRQTSSVDEE